MLAHAKGVIGNGIWRWFFLVSVSEDAAAGFARRGRAPSVMCLTAPSMTG
jgi:hypothetical protein